MNIAILMVFLIPCLFETESSRGMVMRPWLQSQSVYKHQPEAGLKVISYRLFGAPPHMLFKAQDNYV